jgi:hypothetical protein
MTLSIARMSDSSSSSPTNTTNTTNTTMKNHTKKKVAPAVVAATPTSNESKLRSLGESTTANFIKVNGDVSLAKLREKRRSAGQDSARSQRRDSIRMSLSQLDMGLDATDTDTDFDFNLPKKKPETGTKSSQPKYLRRGSVTKHRLEANVTDLQPSSSSTECKTKTKKESENGSNCDQRNGEKEQEECMKPHPRYMRRGSVTKHKLEANATGLQPSSSSSSSSSSTECKTKTMKESENGRDYDQIRNGEKEEEECKKPNPRYMRRGSVTKYSLAGPVTNDMQPDHTRHQPKARMRLPPVPTNSFGKDSDTASAMTIIGIPSCSSCSSAAAPSAAAAAPSSPRRAPAAAAVGRPRLKKRQPQPGDDDYSENLEDSGRFSTRSINIFMDDDEEEDKDYPSNSLKDSGNLDDSGHSRFRPSSLFQTLKTKTKLKKNALEDDSGHTGNNEAKRRDSNSSRNSDDGSSVEFEDDSTVAKVSTTKPPQPSSPKQKQKRPPKLPPTSSPPKKTKAFGLHRINSKAKMAKRRSEPSQSEGDASSTRSAEDAAEVAVAPSKKISTIRKRASSLSSRSKRPSSKPSKASSTTTIPTLSTPTASVLLLQNNNIKGILKKDGRSPSANKKMLRFGNLVITEFPIILGDNPAVTSGAPVTMDWTPQGESSYSINAYEQCRPRRRRRRRLLISVSNRAILLLAAGYSIDDIADASTNAQQIKFGRQQTRENHSWDRVNLMMEHTNDALSGIVQNTGKKLKSLIVKPMQHSETARSA